MRRTVRTRGHFPNDRAATKVIYLALGGVESKWQAAALLVRGPQEFAVVFGDRSAVGAA